MRWTRNDTAAYEAVSKAGQSIRDAYDKSQLGDVYKQGTQVTEVPEADPKIDYAPAIQAYKDAAEWEGPNVPVYTDYRQAEEKLRGLQTEQAAAVARGELKPTPKMYTVGTGPDAVSYASAPTREQIHRGGLTSQYEHLSGQGDVDAAGKIIERISASDAAEQQRKLGGLQIRKAETDISEKDRDIALNKELEPAFNQIALMADGPEKDALKAQVFSRVTSVHGGEKANALMGTMLDNASKVIALDVAKEDKAWRDAAGSEEATLKFYNKNVPDGKDAQIRVNPKTGMRAMVIVDRATGAETMAMQPYAKWDGEGGGREQVIANAPAAAKYTVEKRLAHKNEMEKVNAEIAGREKVAGIYAAARVDVADNKEPKHYIGYDESNKPIAIEAGKKGWEVKGSGEPYHGNRVEEVGKAKAASVVPDKVYERISERTQSIPSKIKKDPTLYAAEVKKINDEELAPYGGSAAPAPAATTGIGDRLKAIAEEDARKAAGGAGATKTGAPPRGVTTAPTPVSQTPEAEAALKAFYASPAGQKALADEAAKKQAAAAEASKWQRPENTPQVGPSTVLAPAVPVKPKEAVKDKGLTINQASKILDEAQGKGDTARGRAIEQIADKLTNAQLLELLSQRQEAARASKGGLRK